MLTVLMSSAQIRNNSYFNLAYTQPLSKYGCEKCSSSNLDKFYKELTNYETHRYALDLQVGANFYLHPVNWVVKPLGIGITSDFIDLQANYYRMKPTADGYNDNMDLFVSYSIGVGPIITLSPAKKFYIDAYAKLVPTFGINYVKGTDGMSIAGNKTALSNVLSTHYNDEESGMCYGLNYSFGGNIRYSKVQIGCEYVIGKLTYDWEDWSKQKLMNNMLKIKLGLSFE